MGLLTSEDGHQLKEIPEKKLRNNICDEKDYFFGMNYGKVSGIH
jgi:hypothetical protein